METNPSDYGVINFNLIWNPYSIDRNLYERDYAGMDPA
jgi:hypothetical protein